MRKKLKYLIIITYYIIKHFLIMEIRLVRWFSTGVHMVPRSSYKSYFFVGWGYVIKIVTVFDSI